MHRRAAVMQDLSGIGHCSLSASMAILPALGVQCCPVPTCVLSTQTDGYTDFSFCDLTRALDPYLAHWESLGERFDAVFTGYLGSEDQLQTALRLLALKKPDGLVLVDPVMGDDGIKYSAVPENMPELMRKLVSMADIITPNLTEACLLTGARYDSVTCADIPELARSLQKLGPKKVVISGIRQNDRVVTVCRDGESVYIDEQSYVEASYPGSGDVFAAVLLGKLLGGADLRSAVSDAAGFVGLCLRESVKRQSPRREGILFEPNLRFLFSDR